MGDIGLVEIPKEDRPKTGQRNLLVQVVAIESDQLVLAPILNNGVAPNLSIRYSATDFVKGIVFTWYHAYIFSFFFLPALNKDQNNTGFSLIAESALLMRKSI